MQLTFLQRTFTTGLFGASIAAAPATAQVGVETFSGGNPDGWQIWFAPWCILHPTGGNPGAYFELDDTMPPSPATCQYLNIFPDRATAVTLSHAGNWRAAGVDQVSIDVNIRTGPLNGLLTLLLVSDPGTPTVPADDCIIRLSQVNPGPIAIGWTTLTFPVDASQVVAPIGWSIEAGAACTGASLNAIWNSVIQDVDEVRFRYDTTPGFCTFTRWQFGIDNITIGTPGPGGPGVNYCTAVVNSTGSAAAMGATGSNMVAANSLTLACSSMPNNAFGYFLTSATQGLVMNPGGSQGDLCLGGSIGRYVGPGQIQNSGGTGGIGLALDLAQHPTPAGFVQVMPGETWHFTCWFRDAVGGSATSNFADGYTVVFQ
jgi:hypothetical protein